VTDDADRLIALESIQEAMSVNLDADDKVDRVTEILAALLIGDEEDSERPVRIEFTVAVCVPMVWDADAGRYEVVDGELALTNGGLFWDAENGPWLPDEDRWGRLEDEELEAASSTAHALVQSRVHS
jgi:hypothetical protein